MGQGIEGSVRRAFLTGGMEEAGATEE